MLLNKCEEDRVASAEFTARQDEAGQLWPLDALGQVDLCEEDRIASA